MEVSINDQDVVSTTRAAVEKAWNIATERGSWIVFFPGRSKD